MSQCASLLNETERDRKMIESKNDEIKSKL